MSTSAPPEIPGLVFQQPVGSGGYADVFLYQQQMPRMPVAVKVLKGEGLTPAIRRQFADEADTMAQLADHPYIVQVFRAETAADGRPYLVMKYYPPPNLAVRARAERFTVEEVLRTGIQLSSAVETAHRAGIIHRDIKPANVLVSQYGAPGLTDFGIAGRGALAEEDDDVGVSVPWAAPEVLFGQTSGDARADIYALAATLWQLLVGRSPFEVPGGDNSAYALMPRIRSSPVPPTGRADVPASLERLLAQSMAKEASSRPATALEFARALQEIEQEQRFAKTAIVVLDEAGHTTLADQNAAAPLDDTDATRVRAPKAVQAQTPLTPPAWHAPTPLSGGTSIPPLLTPPGPAGSGGYAGQPASGTSGTAGGSPAYGLPTGPNPGDLADEGTVRVDRSAARAASEQPSTPSGGTGVSRGLLVGIVGVLVVALVGVLVWSLMRGGGGADDEPDTPQATISAGGDDTPLVDIPQVATVQARSGKGKVEFTWTYPGRLDGDTYRVAYGPDASSVNQEKFQAVSKPAADVSTAAGRQICAQVKVLRSGAATAWSPVACEKAG